MKLLFISQLFDPEYSIKGLGMLSELNDRGIDVEVITTFPNYPTGRVFPGYKVSPWQTEVVNGIRVIRVYSFISHSRSKLARALSYLSFMASVLVASAFIRKPDVIYAYHPQFTIGLVAWLLKKVRGIPYVTDVQDLWPEALVATKVHSDGPLLRVIGSLCNSIYRSAVHIVVLSQGYKTALEARGVASSKISVIYNWNAEEAAVQPMQAELTLPAGYQHKFLYAGNLGRAQALKTAIDAFSGLHEHSVALMIIGAGVEKDMLSAHAESVGAKNIFFLGYVPANMARAYMEAADVLFLHLKDEPLFKITLPSKLQAYLSVGRPVLAAVGGEANQIVAEANAGDVACPEDAASIAAAALRLIAKKDQWPLMGSNGREFYARRMSRAIGVGAVEKVVLSAVSAASGEMR